MKKTMVVCILLALGLTLLIAPAYAGQSDLSMEEQRLLDAYHLGDIIRLHILADSDDPEAQRVKLAVRDAVLAAFGERFSSGDLTSDEVYDLLMESCEGMRVAAEECAVSEGFSGTVSAEAGMMYLPEKRYGNVILPDGDYRALRITLGSGAGQNWWCVLFPQLCLAVASDEPPETEQEESENPFDDVQIVWDTKRILDNWTLCSF